MPTDAQLLDHATDELDNAAQLLDGIIPTHDAHAGMIAEALAAIRKAEHLIASVSLA
jgi:hypothetical protein